MSDKILYRTLFPGILLLIVLTGGCMKQGVPLYYHTLSSPEQPKVSFPPNELPTIQVGPIRVASFLDRQQLVRQHSSNSVSLIEQHRWAGNLSEMLNNALITQLRQQLASEEIHKFPDLPASGGLRLELDFLHFEESQDEMANIKARWRIISLDDQVILHRATSHYRIMPETNNYEGLVQGLSQGLNRLSQEISSKIFQLTSLTKRD